MRAAHWAFDTAGMTPSGAPLEAGEEPPTTPGEAAALETALTAGVESATEPFAETPARASPESTRGAPASLCE